MSILLRILLISVFTFFLFPESDDSNTGEPFVVIYDEDGHVVEDSRISR